MQQLAAAPCFPELKVLSSVFKPIGQASAARLNTSTAALLNMMSDCGAATQPPAHGAMLDVTKPCRTALGAALTQKVETASSWGLEVRCLDLEITCPQLWSQAALLCWRVSITLRQVKHAWGRPSTLEVPDPSCAAKDMHKTLDTTAAQAAHEAPPCRYTRQGLSTSD